MVQQSAWPCSNGWILLLILISPAVVSARWWRPDSCLERAQRTPFDKQFLGSLAMGSRPLPDAGGATDWPQGHMASAEALQERLRCIGPRLFHTAQSALHYKVVNRTIFVEGAHHWHDFPAAKYRKDFDEQLAIATWLYKDFPDVDLFVFFGDLTGGCDLDIPWLQYCATSDPPGHQGSSSSSSSSNSSSSTEYDFDLSEFILPLSSSLTGEGPDLKTNPHMRGYAVPTPDEWHMALTQRQLQMFVTCINRQFPWGRKKADVLWRGRDSGGPGRWTAAEQHTFMMRSAGMDAAAAGASRGTSLANKRIALAAAAHVATKQTFDIGLAGDRYLAASDPPGALVERQLVRSRVPFVPDWAGHMFSVSIDGFGPPFRLPQQLLLGGVVLKMASPMREHFARGLTEGQHFLSFNYNLSNFVDVAAGAVANATGSALERARLQAIATAAQDFAVRNFNVLAELDAVMAAILGVKQHSPWQVAIPEGEEERWVPIASGSLRLRTRSLPVETKREILAWHRLTYVDHVLQRQQQKMAANLLLANDF